MGKGVLKNQEFSIRFRDISNQSIFKINEDLNIYIHCMIKILATFIVLLEVILKQF